MDRTTFSSVYVKIFLCFLITVTLALVFLHSVQASDGVSQRSGRREKVIASVMVEPEDSLWKIAKKYYSKEYKDVRTFVNEIKKTNGLTGDAIHYGNYIIVPYYR